MRRKQPLGSLLLAGLAAYGLYRFSKMNPQQKKNLLDHGKKILGNNLGGIGNILGKRISTPAGNGSM
ncbi:MAG: hypothetical protein ICV66_04070 [Chitinophagaceae bacterium]|nr:hypothetical protein [Chitinophagaceae bacterium]